MFEVTCHPIVAGSRRICHFIALCLTSEGSSLSSVLVNFILWNLWFIEVNTPYNINKRNKQDRWNTLKLKCWCRYFRNKCVGNLMFRAKSFRRRKPKAHVFTLWGSLFAWNIGPSTHYFDSTPTLEFSVRLSALPT